MIDEIDFVLRSVPKFVSHNKMVRWEHIWRATVFLLVLTGLILFFALNGHLALLELVQYLQQRAFSPECILIYVSVFIIISLLGIPVSILSLGAGFIFRPFYAGLFMVVLCVFIGSSTGFFACRYGFREYLLSRPLCQTHTFRIMYQAIERESWRIALLIRLSSMVPFGLGNYILSVTTITYGHFVWTTVMGTLPGLSVFVYAGSVVNDWRDLDGAVGADRRRYLSVMVIIGCVIANTLVFITCIARRAWRDVVRSSVLEEIASTRNSENLGDEIVEFSDHLKTDRVETPPVDNAKDMQIQIVDDEGNDDIFMSHEFGDQDLLVPAPSRTELASHEHWAVSRYACCWSTTDHRLKEPFTWNEKVAMTCVVVLAILTVAIALPLIEAHTS